MHLYMYELSVCIYIYIYTHTHIHTYIGANTYMYMYTVNPSCNETKKKGQTIFFRSRNVPFNTDTLSWDPPNCKPFPLQTGFRYAQSSV